MENPMALPLTGIRVLELGQFLSAPRCGRILAEQGCDVVKIEPTLGEPLRMLMTLTGAEKSLAVVNAGKRGIAVDLKSADGQRVLRKLACDSDVVVENLAPFALDRMGMSLESLRALNPRLITCSISGFGREGVLAERLAFDIIAQASSGIMDATGMPDRPPPVLFADLLSGAHAAMAIGFALFQRERTGVGTHIDLSMQDVMYAQHFHAHNTRALGDDEEQVRAILGRDLSDILSSPDDPLPFWAVYVTRDNEKVALVALTDGHWERLMRAMGRIDLVDDARFSSFPARVKNAREGRTLVEAWTRVQTSEELIETLVGAGIPCARVADTKSVNDDENLRTRGMLRAVTHARLGEIPVPGSVVVVGARRREELLPHPDLGEHTDTVLREAGFADDDIARMRAASAIA
jgi:CoA:oxalate CoA-transferase